MRAPTGSKLPLAMACPASFALPWIDEPPGEMAIRGSEIHAYLERAPQVGRDAALEMAPVETRPYLRAINLDELPVGLQAEAAFAYDWRAHTARYLGAGLGRAYPKPATPTTIHLTIDLLGISPTRVAVDDFKTGWKRYGRPAAFAQTMIGALAACRAFERDEARVGLVYLDEHGEPYAVRDDVDGWALDAFADDVAQTMSEIAAMAARVDAGGVPDVRPGDHCLDLFCPAYRACPHTSGLVRHLPQHVGEVQAPGYLAPARLARTWHQIQQAKKILGAIEEEIRALSFREDIDLGDGTVLGPVETRKESIDAPTARNVLAAFLGAKFADEAISLETTKAAIEKAAAGWRDAHGCKYPPGDERVGKRIYLETAKGDGLLDLIYAEIRRQGGSEVKVTTTPRIHKRKALP